ncbi:MAG: hypothetical protein C4K49_02110 [Candidatus Thorarchaeota archaeon]|nr:MAG: hypothetical protein C4K49_02110 [Candidatus Thorarchaeota archaeon]
MLTVAPALFHGTVILEVIVLYCLNSRTGWVNKRRTRRLVIVISASVLLAIQVPLTCDMISYEQGDIGYSFPDGDWPYDEYVQVEPGETQKLGTVSNWNTLIYLEALTSPSVGNATFYFLDENLPDAKYTAENFSWNGYFRLPYRYTSLFVIANWTANLYNPSGTEPATVRVEIHTWVIEWDNVFGEALFTIWWHVLPLIILPVLWVYVGLSLLLTKPTNTT